jgi:hypothetical protein
MRFEPWDFSSGQPDGMKQKINENDASQMRSLPTFLLWFLPLILALKWAAVKHQVGIANAADAFRLEGALIHPG